MQPNDLLRSDEQQSTAPAQNSPAEPAPPPKWTQIARSQRFQSMDAEDQERLRTQYFKEFVAPRVPEEQIESAWQQWNERTAAPVQDEKGETRLIPRSWGDIKAIPRQFGEGLVGTFGSTVRGAGGLLEAAADKLPESISDRTHLTPFGPINLRKQGEGATKAGDAMMRFSEAIGPDEEHRTIASEISGAGGSLIGFLLPRMIPVVGQAGGTALTLGMAGAGGSDEARQRAMAAGASEDDVNLATFMGVAPGTLQAAPIELLLRRIPAKDRGRALMYARRVAEAAGGEFLAENSGALVQNALAKWLHSPDESLFQEVPERGAISGTAAGLLQVALLPYNRRGGGRAYRPPGDDAPVDPGNRSGIDVQPLEPGSEAVWRAPEGDLNVVYHGIVDGPGGQQMAEVEIDGQVSYVPSDQLIWGQESKWDSNPDSIEADIATGDTSVDAELAELMQDLDSTETVARERAGVQAQAERDAAEIVDHIQRNPDNPILYDGGIDFEVPARSPGDGLSLVPKGQEQAQDGIDFTPARDAESLAQPVVDAANEHLQQQEQEATRRALEGETAEPVRPGIDPDAVAQVYPPDPSPSRAGPAEPRADVPVPEGLDGRMRRPEFRQDLESLAQDLVEGGDIAYIRDEYDRIIGRTSSANPPWFQSMNESPDTRMSVRDTRKAIEKALAGETLGVRQQRVVNRALDEISGQRSDWAAQINAQRETAKRDREAAFEQWRQATDAPVDAEFAAQIQSEAPGESFTETDYLPDQTMDDRAVAELVDIADNMGVEWSSIDTALNAGDTADQSRAITELIWSARNAHRPDTETRSAPSRPAAREGADRALAQAPADPARGDQADSAAEALTLTTQTEQDLQARAEQQAQAEQAEAETRQREQQRAQADRDADDFVLAGSDAAADQAAARGQQDLLSSSPIDATAVPQRTLDRQVKAQTDTSPTEAQKEAGNYRKASINIQGLDISIENPRGSTRSGTDAQGNRWETKMHSHYGYIRRSEGADGDHVDVFVGPNPSSEKVFIVDQVNPDDTFDEHKVLLGFDSKLRARSGYKANYTRGWKVGPITSMTMDEFKAWLKEGNTSKPLSDHFRGARKKVGGAQHENQATKSDSGSAEASKTKTPSEGRQTEIKAFGEEGLDLRREQDKMVSLSKNLSNEDIASLPLSKIWPKSEVDSIEDKATAAFATAARAEIPSKPRKQYALNRWVGAVQAIRELTNQYFQDPAVVMEKMRDKPALRELADKVALLSQIDRQHWGRVDGVAVYTEAYRFDENGRQVPAPFVSVQIDGKRHRFDGESTVDAVVDRVKTLLGDSAPESGKPRMKFTLRGRKGHYFFHKEGDPEYRHLKEFSDLDAARAYLENNHADLVAAWERIKERDNVKKTDTRSKDNRPRSGADHRQGRDVSVEEFHGTFGLRHVDWGKWVSDKGGERQALLNEAYDAMMDLASITGLPPKALGLNGALIVTFGKRGSGNASAHFEAGGQIINLTKTKGAGSLAHEWFHALDNYFQRLRGEPKGVRREAHFVTYAPERMLVHKSGRMAPLTKAKLEHLHKAHPEAGIYKPENWSPDPTHPEGVRPQVEARFAELVDVLDSSPMKGRALTLDKDKPEGYWSRIIERAARSFENYTIAKMQKEGYHNDFLANVVSIDRFRRNPNRYPYLLESEMYPVVAAFDNLFAEMDTRQTESGIALFSIKPETKQAYEARIDALFDGEKAGRVGVKVLDSSDILGLLGHPDLPVHVNESKVIAGQHNHGLTAEHWKKIPDWLENPVAVFDSDTVPGRLVVIAPETVRGAPVMMILEPNARVEAMDVHLLVNAYDKDGKKPPIARWANDGLMRYGDEKTIPAFNRSSGLQLPGVSGIQQGYGHKIYKNRDLVKYRAARPPAASVASEASTGQPIAAKDAQAVIDRIQAKIKDKGLTIQAVRDFSEFPAAVRRHAEQQGFDGQSVEGVYHQGAIYLNRSALNSRADVERVVLHELYGHFGIRKLFDKGTRQAMGRLYLAIGGAKGVRQLAEKHGIDMRHYAQGLIAAEKQGLHSREVTQSVLAEELLAHLAQDNRPSVQRYARELIGAIRTWLRQHGFLSLSKVSDSELFHLLKQARQAVEQGRVTGQPGLFFTLADMPGAAPLPAFALVPRETRKIIGDDPVLAAWTMLSQNDGAFQLPTSNKKMLTTIFKELEGDRGMTVERADELALQNDYGAKAAWRITTPQGEKAAVYQKGKAIWIDVHDLKQGESGRRIYNAVANYAYNTDRVFVGDPDGLSDVALTRRLENMISSALKFGTTKHLWPHDRQIEGSKGMGVPGIQWKDGNDAHNLRQMIDASYQATAKQFPEIRDLRYNPDKDVFENAKTREVLDGKWFDEKAAEIRGLQDTGRAGGAPTAGRRTLERAVLTHTLLRAEGGEVTRILERFGQLGSERLTGPENAILYSRKPTEPRPSAGVSRSEESDSRFNVLRRKTPESAQAKADREALQDGSIQPHWKEFLKLRGFWDSASDVLRRNPKLRHVAEAVDKFFDQTRDRMGQVNKIIDPAMKVARKLPKKERKIVFDQFEAFVRHRENGRAKEAKALLAKAHPAAQQLVLAWTKVADISGRINQEVGVQVYDGKIGGWRLIGKLKEFFPRTYKPEVMEAIANPAKHPEVWREIARQLHRGGQIEANNIEQALEFMSAYEAKYQDKTQQDYFAGIEKARGEPLPEWFYDYSWDAAMAYKDRWAENVSRIEAFGQRSVGGTDVFDQAISKTTDRNTKEYLGRVQERVYNTASKDPYIRLMGSFNMVVTGLMLGNPGTAALNLFGGTGLNFQAYGFKHAGTALKDLTLLGKLASEIKDARERGILIDDYLSAMHDGQQQGVNKTISTFTDKMLKWGGYTPMEIFIRTHAMVTQKHMLRDALKHWNKKTDSRKSLRYMAWYQRYGFDTNKLLAENGEGPETNRLLRMSVNLTQGSYKVNQVPVFVDSPIGRFLFKYQKFGTQLSRMFWLNALKPFVDSIHKGGETVRYTKDGKEYSARVRTFMPLFNYFAAAFGAGTVLTIVREALFGYSDPGPNLDELEKALEDDDKARAVALAFSRLHHSILAVGAAGFFGNYAQMIKDINDRQRVKNPLDPPALAPIKGAAEIVLRSAEQRKLTGRDVDEIASQQLSIYRTLRRASLAGLSHTTDWDAARLEMLNRDRNYTRQMIRRYADEIGLENRRMASGRFGKTPMSPVNANLVDAIMLGQPERAQAIMYNHLVTLNTPADVDRALTSMRAAVRARQPVRVSQSPSERERRAFLQWVEGRVGDENYQRIVDLDQQYRSAAIEAGLMRPENLRNIRRQEVRFEQGNRELTPAALEAYLRRQRIRRPTEDQ